MIEHFKDADEAQAHAQPQETSGIPDEVDVRNLLSFQITRIVGIADKEVQHGQVLWSVVKQEFYQTRISVGDGGVGAVVVVADFEGVVHLQDVFAAERVPMDLFLEDRTLDRIGADFGDLLENEAKFLAVDEGFLVREGARRCHDAFSLKLASLEARENWSSLHTNSLEAIQPVIRVFSLGFYGTLKTGLL